jgi:hypothetical protein
MSRLFVVEEKLGNRYCSANIFARKLYFHKSAFRFKKMYEGGVTHNCASVSMVHTLRFADRNKYK